MTDQLDRLKTSLSDRYTIERELGRGGMAVVYLARDLKHERQVAIKVLRSELAASIGADRFLQEVKIAANLTHPHILPLHDSGEADGFLYYVMPYVEGESLRDKLAKEGELPVSDAVRILKEVVDALAEAHSNGVVHRDIKPDNIMLRGRHALVTDFGVAKAVSEATGRQQLTTEGVALGTPTYMAPEQAAADPHIDHRADIYAVGAVAYELLTGRPPFMGTTPQMILSAHLTDTPEPVTKYRDSVPPALEQLVLKCLEKKAADRWQTAEELLPQLEALTTPSGGMTPTGTMPVDRVAKRKWMMLGGAIGVAAIIAVLAVLAALPRGASMALNPDQVVVAVFRNETADPSFDQLGSRIGHWITQGLQHAAIPVTPWDIALQSWEYVESEVDAGRTHLPLIALAHETGAATVVSGAIYTEGDSVVVQVDVTDATRGIPLGSPPTVRGARDKQGQLVGNVQQQVMVFLAANSERLVAEVTPDLLGEAPTYEAYQSFVRGLQLGWGGNPEGAIPHFQRAHELDSTWVQPLIRMRNMYSNLGRYAQRDSVLGVLEGFGDRLSPYEKAVVQAFRAATVGDREQEVRAYRQAAELAPRSGAAYLLAFNLLHLNRPREALDVLLTFDPARGWAREFAGYWSQRVRARLMLGQHVEALHDLEVAKSYHPASGMRVWEEGWALAALGQIEGVQRVVDEIIAEHEIYEVRLHSVTIIEALEAYGHLDTAGSVSRRVLDWFESRTATEWEDDAHQYSYGKALYVAGRVDDAVNVFQMLDQEPRDEVPPHVQAFASFISVVRGDSARAFEYLDWLDSRDPNPSLTFTRAVVTGSLGNREAAVELLREAATEGYSFNFHHWAEPYFAPLRGYLPFEEFMRPKG